MEKFPIHELAGNYFQWVLVSTVSGMDSYKLHAISHD